ncbi:hypothetical protein AWV79_02445 [Cupriavidus sp. UYMMa02A]|nr:hypothetical protein AWV79_02445 [Cupriavidus sp. UYMMa02A]
MGQERPYFEGGAGGDWLISDSGGLAAGVRDRPEADFRRLRPHQMIKKLKQLGCTQCALADIQVQHSG